MTTAAKCRPFEWLEIEADTCSYRGCMLKFSNPLNGELLAEITDEDKSRVWFQKNIMDLFDLMICGEDAGQQLAMDALGETGYVATCDCERALHAFDYERGFCPRCLVHING